MKTDPPAPGTPRTDASARRGSSPNRGSIPRPRRHWGWIILGILVLLLGVGALTAKPAWRAVKAVRAKRFLAESEEFMRQEQWTQAFERTRSALQLAPVNPQVLRHAAQLHARFGSEMALNYYQLLLTLPSATTADREGYASLALGLGDVGLAGTVIEQLLEQSKPSPRTLLLGSQYYAVRRELPRALSLARDSVKGDPSNPTNVLALAGLLTASRRPADRREAIEVLWPFAQTNGPFQLRALNAILNAPDSPREDRERIESILAADPNPNLEADLLLMETRISLDPSQRNRIADQVIQRLGRGSEEQLASVASWLNRQQLYTRTLTLLLPDVSIASARLSRLRYDALMGAEQYRAAYDFISDKKFQGDPVQIEFLRCTTAMKLENEAATDSHLLNLLDLARRRPRHLRAVAEFARRNGKIDIANQANQILIRNPREALPAFQSLLRTADAQGETWVARDYARKLLSLRKEDEGVKLQATYYDLLLEENVEQALRTAEALHQGKPDDFNRRAVLALAYLRENQPAKAVALIEGQVVTWRKLPAGIRAVILATLGANDRKAAVTRLLDRIPLGSLKPEERELIRPYLAGITERDAEDGDDTPEKL